MYILLHIQYPDTDYTITFSQLGIETNTFSINLFFLSLSFFISFAAFFVHHFKVPVKPEAHLTIR